MTEQDIPSHVVADVAADYYDEVYDDLRGVHYSEIGQRLADELDRDGVVREMWACDIVAEAVDLAVEDKKDDREKRDPDDAVDVVLARLDPGE